MELEADLTSDTTTATAMGALRTGRYSSVIISVMNLERAYLINVFLRRCAECSISVRFADDKMIDRIITYDSLHGDIDIPRYMLTPCS